LPVLGIARGATPQHGMIWLDNANLRVTVENQGAATATVERSVVDLPGGGGATGETVGGDTVEPQGGQLTIEFPLAAEQIPPLTRGDDVNVGIVYSAPGAERRKQLLAVVKPKDGGDRWILLRDRIKDA
jgi:hypothetical protein